MDGFPCGGALCEVEKLCTRSERDRKQRASEFGEFGPQMYINLVMQ